MWIVPENIILNNPVNMDLCLSFYKDHKIEKRAICFIFNNHRILWTYDSEESQRKEYNSILFKIPNSSFNSLVLE